MGVGFPVDILLCACLGVDMFDCVYASRTARFGTALTDKGLIKLKNKEFQFDFDPIDKNCDCEACQLFTKSYLNSIILKEEVACSLLTKHNIKYLINLCKRI